MEEVEAKAMATVVTWLILGGIIISAMLAAELDSITLLILAMMLLLAALGTTQFIWTHRLSEDTKRKNESTQQDNRLALLVELMDEDEREQLKHRLMNELEGDGEVLSLEDLQRASKS